MCGERRDARWVDAHYCCSACRTRDRVRGILLETARPLALMLSVVSLWAVFYTAFLGPVNDIENRSWEALLLLSLAAGICVSSGMLFREGSGRRCRGRCRCRCFCGRRA